MHADLPTDIRVASLAGFQGVEIWAEKMDRYLGEGSVSSLKGLFEEHGIVPVSINSIEFITFRSTGEYNRIRDRCQQLCAISQALGCGRIVVVPSPLPEGKRIAREFLGFHWCSVRTLSECWEIVRETNKSNVGLVIDACHFYTGESSLESIDRIDPEKILIFHINDVEDRPKESIEDAHRLLPGGGVIPLRDLLERLRGIGYDGPCSIELFRPAYWNRDPLELARAARKTTLEVLARSGC
jgi:2-keto-myo-inositol isomerase